MTGTTAPLTGEHLLRDLAPQVLGAIVRRFGDFHAAEDAVQEALLAAAMQWPNEGVPDNPRGWLIHVAARRITDQLRSDRARRRREAEVVSQAAPEGHMLAAPDALLSVPDLASSLGASTIDSDSDDDTLILLFLCSHPALTRSAAIALTLRAVGGLATAQIAQAFLVPEATMAQRISRAKQRIKASAIPFRLPTPAERAERLAAVLHVLYLVFNEGYSTSSGRDLQRPDLSAEAIRLTRRVHALLPGDAEVAGLLALMLLTDARRRARTGPEGELIPLDQQDRALWDRAAIEEGMALVTQALSRGVVGAYQLQAAIAALHDEAQRVEDTDWPQILALYGLLERMSDNPMVTLNRAIATAMVQGPSAGLQMLATLDSNSRLAGHHRVHAVRAHLLEMSGAAEAAVIEYRAAADLTRSIPERNYLLTRAARLDGGDRG